MLFDEFISYYNRGGVNRLAHLKYLKLDPDSNINKFVDAKNEKIKGNYVGRDCLPKVSEIFDIGDDYPNSLLTQEVLQQMEQELELKKEKQKFENELNIIQMEFNKETKGTNFQIIENFIKNHQNYEQIDAIIDKLNTLKKEQEKNKDSEVNAKFDSAYKALENKKSNPKQYKNELDKFIKKWNKKQNHKTSKYILEFLENLS